MATRGSISMTDNLAKPRLVFFQYKYDEQLPKFLLEHKREHVHCLQQFFDVTVIQEDCDYQQVCDTYQPDVALFESGVPFATCRRPAVHNLRACPQVPKLGFLHADAFSEGREGFLSDMDHWGIETFFAIATTAAEHTPSIAENLFIWPVFVNAELHRDYGQTKNIPVLFTGNKNSLYPWRQQIVRLVPKHLPSLICPHPGYSPQSGKVRIVVGEPYARMLNASLFVPACGTVAKEVVRKHFEVPACRSCLVTERSAGLEAAGFVDMKNCVFVDESDVLDKLGYLLDHPEELQRITDAGHELVHARHTMKSRDQIFQWFQLNRSLQPNQRIVQNNPFGSLEAVERSSGKQSNHVHSNGGLVSLVREGNEKLWSGDYDGAEALYLRCVNHYRYMPEPLLGLTICNLHKGKAGEALNWIVRPLEVTLADYQAIDADPVEWAYFLLTLLCLGRVDEAIKRGKEFAWMSHPELNRMRFVLRVISEGSKAATLEEDGDRQRRTMHELPQRSFDEWLQQVFSILRANGRADLAEKIVAAGSHRGSGTRPEERCAGADEPRADEAKLRTSPMRQKPWVYGRSDASGIFNRRRLSMNTSLQARQMAKRVLHKLENRLGNQLPFKYSKRKYDELFQTVYQLAQEGDVRTALVIGANGKESITEAFLAGCAERKDRPVVICLTTAPAAESASGAAVWKSVSAATPEGISAAMDQTIEAIKAEKGIDHFDLILLDGAQLATLVHAAGTKAELHRAGTLVMDGVNRSSIHEVYEELQQDEAYAVVDHNHALREGYAVLEKIGRSADRPQTQAAKGVIVPQLARVARP